MRGIPMGELSVERFTCTPKVEETSPFSKERMDISDEFSYFAWHFMLDIVMKLSHEASKLTSAAIDTSLMRSIPMCKLRMERFTWKPKLR